MLQTETILALSSYYEPLCNGTPENKLRREDLRARAPLVLGVFTPKEQFH